MMDLTIAAWNIRGLGTVSKQDEIKNLIWNEKLSICAVLETHMKKNRIEQVCANVFGSWQWQNNVHMSSKGCRIAVGWDANNVICSLVHATSQAMLYHIEILSTQKTMFCTFIYAANKGRDRKELWKDLVLFNRIVGQNPWALMGDVNVCLNLCDHSEGISHYTQDMVEFQDCMNTVEMEDINSTGLHFTWTKSLMNPDATVLKKIDRVMGNCKFFDMYNNANAVFLPYGISDHNLAILIIPQVMHKRNKSFRFTNYIANKTEFQDLVAEKWNMEIQGHAMYRLVKKLKVLKPHLNKLNWKNGNLFDKVVELKRKLHDVQGKIDLDPANRNLRKEESDILIEYKDALSDEEKLLRQKAKVTWLNVGDKNSAYFHKVIKGRTNKSRILTICGEDGTRYEHKDVAEQFVKHFKGFLGINPDVGKLGENDDSLFMNKVSEEEAEYMIRGVTDDEIKMALFDIDDDKAPGPDGFTSKFFKKAWAIVKKDFCDAIKDFFLEGKLLGEINATLIALVPKSQTPQRVSEFRPIACCNVIYKCISKILTNRIKKSIKSSG